MIGILVLGLMLTAAHSGGSYCSLVVSAQNFRENLKTLNNSGTSLGPVERFVFSLMLLNSEPQPEGKTSPHHTS